jgi:hypothetical protein
VLVFFSESFDLTKNWDSDKEFTGFSWGAALKPKKYKPRHLDTSTSSSAPSSSSSSSSSSGGSSSSSNSAKASKKRKKPAVEDADASDGEDVDAHAERVKALKARALRKARQKQAVVAGHPSLLQELSSEAESDDEQKFIDELSSDEEVEVAEEEEDKEEVLDWVFGVDLPEPTGVFDGVGHPSVPVSAATSARFCFDLVMPASLRALVIRETNRYGVWFADWRIRAGKPPVPWVNLIDSELCVFLGLVVEHIYCTRHIFFDLPLHDIV